MSLDQAKILNNSGDYSAALNCLYKLYSQNRLDNEVLYQLFIAFINIRKHRFAKWALTRALKLAPENSKYLLELLELESCDDQKLKLINHGLLFSPSEFELYQRKAELLLKQQRLSQALVLYRQMFKRFPTRKEDLISNRAMFLTMASELPIPVRQGVCISDERGKQYAIGLLQMAIKDLTYLINLGHNEWHNHFRRAQVRSKLQDYYSAEEDYQMALDKLDDNEKLSYEGLVQQELKACRYHLRPTNESRYRMAHSLAQQIG